MKNQTSESTKPESEPAAGGRRSSIDRLPAQLREAADAAIADGATIDEITARIRAEGETCSRSAVGRYAKNTRDLIRQQQETDRTIKAWVDALGERPEGGAGRIMIETLQSMVLATMAALSGRDEPASLQELGRLSLILKRIEDTEKLRKDRERKAAAEKAEQAEKTAQQAAAADTGPDEAQQGLSPETVAALHEAVTRLPGPNPDPARKKLSPETVAAMREALLGPPPRTVTSVPVDPWNPAEYPAVPANPGESHLIPDDCGESQSQSIRDSHYESWTEIAPRVYRTSPTSILSLGPG